MATFVLIHGAWGGGTAWRAFAPLLREKGHRVFAPSLTGLGERAHLASPETNLSSHVEDVVAIVEYEELSDIVLVGHSYGGMVVTGAVERIGGRIAHLVYVDAFLPRDGESCWGPDQLARANLEDGWKVLPLAPAATNGGPPARRFGQPVRTLDEKVRLSTPLERHPFTRTYIKAGGSPPTPVSERRGAFWEAAARVREDPAWRYYELPCGHGIHRELPEATAGILLGLAAKETPVPAAV